MSTPDTGAPRPAPLDAAQVRELIEDEGMDETVRRVPLLTSTESGGLERPMLRQGTSPSGDALPESWQRIWAEADRYCPDSRHRYEASAIRSAFNDGAHWLIAQVAEATKKSRELIALQEAAGEWTDREAADAFNTRITAAHRDACRALNAFFGDDFADAMFWSVSLANVATVPTDETEGDE